MHKRKIQLIAGTTYSISLPKEWIKKSNLKEKDELSLNEKDDGSLILTNKIAKEKKINEISLNLKDYQENIDQVLFALYYLGIEKIEIYSKEDIPKELKAKIRKSFSHMSASEISYEDKKKIVLNIYLDKSKIDIHQIIQRVSLIIDLSIENILEGVDKKEIKLNEAEIDRLYHLASKIITQALINTNILKSSKVEHTLLIPSYFLICKKLETIGDAVNHLATHVLNTKTEATIYEKYLTFIREEHKRIIKHILNGFPKIFDKIEDKERRKIKKEIYEIEDKLASDYLKEILRLTRDIEDELVQVSFNLKLLQENKI